MKDWYCPKCDYKMKAMGIEAYHPCPKSRGKAQVKLKEGKRPRKK